jgi:hypothetical protein
MKPSLRDPAPFFLLRKSSYQPIKVSLLEKPPVFSLNGGDTLSLHQIYFIRQFVYRRTK